MVVSAQFCGVQRAIIRVNEIQFSLSGGSRVSDLFKQIKRSYPDLPLSKDDITVSINDQMSNMNHTLSPNDKVTFLPHIGGG
ncbi:MAG: MoaD/ThiS family protein [Desulfobacteraceae bacterium]|nr:MoaD/ThiS family protein [Desulfobacterales bacterium]MBL6967024.1 MoaD/ThiS family protein [Desulfobacteraceae bacterium]